MTCRTCVHLAFEPRSDGKIVPTRNSVYPCLMRVGKRPIVPACVQLEWPPHRRWVSVDDGENCPTYAKRPKSALNPQEARND